MSTITIRRLLSIVALFVFLAAPHAQAVEYIGICEASAGAFLDDKHFVVASDETNKLQLYERGNPSPIGGGIDMESFTSFDKSDLEGAALIGDRVYWISSHSFNSSGEDKPKRKVFFATKIGQANGKTTLAGVGKAVKSLRDPIAKAAKVKPSEMNIEGLAATPDGGLLIGLRAPQREGMALVVPFKNPAAVIDNGAVPEFSEAVPIDLEGRGIRSIDLIGKGIARYIIIAGPHDDGPEAFVMFRWAGAGTKPEQIKGLDLAGLKPEGAMGVPGQDLVQLISDDGHICSDEKDPPNKRRFRSVDVKP